LSKPSDETDDLLARIETRIAGDAAWRTEFERSAAEYFPPDARASKRDDARRRHLEWFLFERTDAAGPELAIERAAAQWPQETGLDRPGAIEALRQTHVGILEVTSVVPGEGLWLRDLGGRGEFPITDAEASRVIEVGDLVAGRLFPLPDGLYRMSSSAAFHRDARLVEALRADFERARQDRRGVLRVGQREIEAMFFAESAPAPVSDPVAAARTLLLESGVDAETADGWLEELAQAPFDEDRLLHGAQDVLSDILDEIAFDSVVDLEAARRALLAAWAELARRGPGEGKSLTPAAPPGSTPAPVTDVARAIELFEERRRAGQPITQLLDELERNLALGDADGDELDGDPTPDFPGVVGAVVEEFLWEVGRTQGDAAARQHANLRDLGRATEHVGVFENLRGRDLLVYAGWWLSETGTLGGSDDARQRLASLSAFCHWAEAEHEVTLQTEFGDTLDHLATSLPRIAEANQRKTRGARRDEGELFEIVALDGETARVRGRAGDESDVEIQPDLATWLRAGDRVRGKRHADGRLAVYCCYPPEVAELVAGPSE
jgi:hypothetical protein